MIVTTMGTEHHQAQQSIWLWRSDDDLWELFDARDAAEINTALSRNEEGLVLQRRSHTYFIDLERRTQTNVETGSQRRIAEVRPNSEWLRDTSMNSKEAMWEKVPLRDALEMERALFTYHDSVVLERGSDLYYVDFSKWTMTNLKNGKCSQIKVKSIGVTLHRRDSSGNHSNLSSMSNSSNTSHPPRSSPSSSRTYTCCHHNQQHHQQHQHLERPPLSIPPSTTTTRQLHPEPQHRPVTPINVEEEEILPFGARLNESDKCKKFMNPQESAAVSSSSLAEEQARTFKRYAWHWRNDHGSWSNFDDDVVHKIEEALNKGEESFMFMRESAAYYVDLVNFIQTNVNTGGTRHIRRMQATSTVQ